MKNIEMQEIKNKKAGEIKLQIDKVGLLQTFFPVFSLDLKPLFSFDFNIFSIYYTKKYTLGKPSPRNSSPGCAGYQIPDEIWPLIMALLDDKSLLMLISTCRKFNNISEHPVTEKRLHFIKNNHENELRLSEMISRSHSVLNFGV